MLFIINIILGLFLFLGKDNSIIRTSILIITAILALHEFIISGFNYSDLCIMSLSILSLDIIFILIVYRLYHIIFIFILSIIIVILYHNLNLSKNNNQENLTEVSYLYRYNPVTNTYTPVDWTIDRYKK